MQENIDRLREISEEIDELFTEAIDIVGGLSQSIDSNLAKLQLDSSETIEEAILALENAPEVPSDDEEEDDIDDDDID